MCVCVHKRKMKNDQIKLETFFFVTESGCFHRPSIDGHPSHEQLVNFLLKKSFALSRLRCLCAISYQLCRKRKKNRKQQSKQNKKK